MNKALPSSRQQDVCTKQAPTIPEKKKKKTAGIIKKKTVLGGGGGGGGVGGGGDPIVTPRKACPFVVTGEKVEPSRKKFASVEKKNQQRIKEHLSREKKRSP